MIKDIILLIWAVGAVEARSDVTSERSEVSRHFINLTYKGEFASGGKFSTAQVNKITDLSIINFKFYKLICNL